MGHRWLCTRKASSHYLKSKPLLSAESKISRANGGVITGVLGFFEKERMKGTFFAGQTVSLFGKAL